MQEQLAGAHAALQAAESADARAVRAEANRDTQRQRADRAEQGREAERARADDLRAQIDVLNAELGSARKLKNQIDRNNAVKESRNRYARRGAITLA